MKQLPKHRKVIPKFDTYEEEAAFWDTHSPFDFPEELVEDTEITVARPLIHLLAVQLDAATITKLGALGRWQGLSGAAALAEKWLRERLAQEQDNL
ncbi:MAG: hypothetical protein NTZ05_12110 [Chloroflexi bacterium]|nr:hypothetical protein [Chloroflexota bacterium]